MKIAVAGCAGRMGQAIIKKILATPGVTLTAGSVRTSNGFVGEEIGALVGIPTPGALLYENPEALFAHAEAVIDFTNPDYSEEIATLAARHKAIHVCGTTALKEHRLSTFKKHARTARIICSPNFSIGVTIAIGLVERIAQILPPEDYDIDIDEMHHRFKVDAPSGTALSLGAAAARGRNVQLSDVRADYIHTGLGARKQGGIGFSVRRGGDVIGDHTVTFSSLGERIEISHKSSSRDIYAGGAIRAALWAAKKPAGFYTMRDVLGV